MTPNTLYFIKDEYFVDFTHTDNKPNKVKDENGEHNRPCYYAFEEDGIYWMVPVSSQYEKYHKIYDKKIEKYGVCDTIVLGYVKGNKNAFLIQNMIPVTQEYISNQYIDKSTSLPVKISKQTKKELNAKVRKVLRFARNGKILTYTPILQIEQMIRSQITNYPEVASTIETVPNKDNT